jgi:hypothetical protein
MIRRQLLRHRCPERAARDERHEEADIRPS